MSLLPRLFARRTPSPALLFTNPSLFVPLSTPSCSRRSYSDEAPEEEAKKKKTTWLKRYQMIPQEATFPESQWEDISNDIIAQLPPKVLGEHPIREIPVPKGELFITFASFPPSFPPSLPVVLRPFSVALPPA